MRSCASGGPPEGLAHIELHEFHEFARVRCRRYGAGRNARDAGPGAQFTRFTRTRVQILTPEALRVCRQIYTSAAEMREREMLARLLARTTLLDLLVQKGASADT
jgi:hypothetical protein